MKAIGAPVEQLQSYFPKAKPMKLKEKMAFKIFLVKAYFQIIGHLFPSIAGKTAFKMFTRPLKRARHRKSDEVLERAKISDFLYGGQMLKVYEWGTGDKVILLVHGWESRGTAMRNFVGPFLRRGYKIVTFDGPAHGDSGGKEALLTQFGGAVKAILNRLGKVEGIIAHSFGGAASSYALESLGNQYNLKYLALVGVPSRMLTGINGIVRAFNVPNVVKRNMIKRLENANQIAINEADILHSSKSMNVNQVLILHDKKDEIVPYAEAERIASNLPNSKLVYTEGYGHYKILKNPDVVSRIINFFETPTTTLAESST